ncbi:MAG: tape measure protein [Bacillota bacterium]|nr:tape measure protein [Bacillota bacterium]
MATISNTIDLTDAMSPILYSACDAFNDLIDYANLFNDTLTSIENSFSGAFNADQIDDAVNGFNNATDALGGADNNAETLNQTLEDTTTSSENVNNSLGNMRDTLLVITQGAEALRGVFEGISKFAETADEYNNANQQLTIMTDNLQQTKALQEAVNQAAQDSRSSYEDLSSEVLHISQVAGGSFKNAGEMVQFAKNLNEQMAVAGQTSEHTASAVSVISRMLLTGKVQGRMLANVLAEVPGLGKEIQKHLGISNQQFDEMVKKGKLSADVIKDSVLASTKDLSEEMKNTPMTFAQTATEFKNKMNDALQPLFKQLQKLLSDPSFQKFINGAINLLSFLVSKIGSFANFVINHWQTVATTVAGLLLVIAGAWIAENWQMALAMGAFTLIVTLWNNFGNTGKIIVGIIGALALAWGIYQIAQWSANAAADAFPLTWVLAVAILAIILFITILYQLAMHAKTVFGFIAGSSLYMLATIKDVGIEVATAVLNVIQSVVGGIQGLINGALQAVSDLINTVTGGINSLINIVDKIPGVHIGQIGTVDFKTQGDWTSGIKNTISDMQKQIVDPNKAYQYGYSKGSDFGAGIQSWTEDMTKKAQGLLNPTNKENNDATGKTSNDLLNQIMKNTGGTDGDSSLANGVKVNGGTIDKIGGDISINKDNLKYLKDIAKAQYTQMMTPPNFNVTFSGDIHKDVNLDDLSSAVETMTYKAYARALIPSGT